jgi:hypothetical protein
MMDFKFRASVVQNARDRFKNLYSNRMNGLMDGKSTYEPSEKFLKRLKGDKLDLSKSKCYE